MKFKVFKEEPNILDQCKIFIGGWHGLGEIGYITVSHLVQELKMKRVATIMSSGAPPFILFEQRAFFQFDTSTLPDNATVTKVEFNKVVDSVQPTTAPDFIYIYRRYAKNQYKDT